MSKAMEWAYTNGIPLGISPMEFGNQVNEKLDMLVPLNQSPELCAQEWLSKIESLSKSNN